MKLAIVGTRNPGVSYKEWESLLLSKVETSDVSLIVSGGAKGIDTYAKLFAGRHGIPLMEFPPLIMRNMADSPLFVAILK